MSVSVQSISKRYGEQLALDAVSFEIPKGHVVGFLGPNGAGKSTMMKILTGYLPPTAGRAAVCGFDVVDESLEVRRRVGYLPEHNPLYLDLYVREYLEFVAGLYRTGAGQAGRIRAMIEATGLGPEQHKKIGALSKGYRQRVGLAQALLHDPEVLILDEPTSGLDPNQLSEIRILIKSLGREKTVLLSTHIMQEVEALCDRVIIINKGRIVADDTTDLLRRKAAPEAAIRVSFDRNPTRSQLMQLKGVRDAENMTDTHWRIVPDEGQDVRPELLRYAVENGLTVQSLQVEEQRLEDVFQLLTR